MVAVSVGWVQTASVVPEALSAYLARLPTDEQERAARYRFPRDRNLFVLARTLARHMLTQAAGPRDWRFGKDAYGKLAIDPPFGDPPLHFNVTHTDGVVACVTAFGIPVGIDVERIDRELDLAEVMQTTFAPEEIAAFERCGPEAKAEYFFTTWTLKEAIAKARGLGLAMPFSDVCLALEPQPRVVRDPGENADGWRLTSHAPLPTHRLAIALAPHAGKEAAVSIRTIEPTALA